MVVLVMEESPAAAVLADRFRQTKDKEERRAIRKEVDPLGLAVIFKVAFVLGKKSSLAPSAKKGAAEAAAFLGVSTTRASTPEPSTSSSCWRPGASATPPAARTALEAHVGFRMGVQNGMMTFAHEPDFPS